MEIHSNSLKLYYGFNIMLLICLYFMWAHIVQSISEDQTHLQ